jgi:Protein of unknown function (DUF1688)
MSAVDSADRAAGGDAELRYLRSPRAIRERCEAIYALARRGELRHWAVDESQLDPIARRVAQTTRVAYPDVRAIPGHSRWRHFSAGGVDRARAFDERLEGLPEDERLAARFDLVITSVLLDAGAGDRWRYRETGGQTYSRSEGIAVASYDLFVAGAFSSDPDRAPLRADAAALERATSLFLGRGLQVDEDNPMIGVEGRAALLQRLGAVVRAQPEWGGRLGGFGIQLRRAARSGQIPAAELLGTVLEALGSIWPGREVCAGQNLGDVWTHGAAGRVPLHKLSQWLTYSLFEPLERAGVTIGAPGELTGLAEYRNGGLFVDGGALVPRHEGVLRDEHEVSSDVVIEWRALTLVLLDRIAERVRGVLGISADELPLAKVLEGGTWRAGRELAAEKRPGGGPPLRVRSDGTVF